MCNKLEEIGGVQRVTRTLADAFLRSGESVELIDISSADEPYRIASCFAPPQHRLFRDAPRLRGVAENLFRGKALGMRFERLRFIEQRRAIVRLRNILRKQPAVCIAMDVFAAELLAKAAPPQTVTIFQYHNSFQAIAGTRDEARVRKLATQLDVMVALTEEDASAFCLAGMGRWYFVDNPLPYTAPTESLVREKLVVAVARFTLQKSLHVMLQAWASVAAAAPDWRLEIVGSGPLEQELRAKVQQLQLQNIAILPPTNDVAGLLARASIYALSSQYEGLPMVVIEALAFRVPVVATDCSPGVRQLIGGAGGGLLCSVGDHRALAADILTLIRQPDLREKMGRAGHDSVRRYQQPQVVAAWRALIAKHAKSGNG